MTGQALLQIGDYGRMTTTVAVAAMATVGPSGVAAGHRIVVASVGAGFAGTISTGAFQ